MREGCDSTEPRGGGHCLFEGRYPKQNYRPPVLCYHSPPSLSLLVYSPLFLRHQKKTYCYYCCYCGLPPVDIIFISPHTITLITVAKTLIIANPGCPPSESSWVRDSPPLSSLQPQLRESILQWVPKTRVSAPPPPPPPPPGQNRGSEGLIWVYLPSKSNIQCPLGCRPSGVDSLKQNFRELLAICSLPHTYWACLLIRHLHVSQTDSPLSEARICRNGKCRNLIGELAAYRASHVVPVGACAVGMPSDRAWGKSSLLPFSARPLGVLLTDYILALRVTKQRTVSCPPP